MPDFSKEFLKSMGEPITYNGETLYLSHKFPVRDGDMLAISIEKTNSNCRQGLCVDITGSCEMDGKTYKVGKGVGMLFWEDTSAGEIKLKVHTKRDFVWVENIWEKASVQVVASLSGEVTTKESKHLESRYYGSAMIVDAIEGGFRYKCNDWHPDANFDDIVFTVKKMKEQTYSGPIGLDNFHSKGVQPYGFIADPENWTGQVVCFMLLKPLSMEIQNEQNAENTLYFQQGMNAKGLQIYESLKHMHFKKAEALISSYGSTKV